MLSVPLLGAISGRAAPAKAMGRLVHGRFLYCHVCGHRFFWTDNLATFRRGGCRWRLHSPLRPGTQAASTFSCRCSRTAFVVSNYAYQAAQPFYNAMMPELRTALEERGRLSGIGTAVGYVGTIVGLILIVPLPFSGGVLRAGGVAAVIQFM